MIETGFFPTKDGKFYAVLFFSDTKEVKAVGPLPDLIDKVSGHPIAFTDTAESEEEACNKIHEAIEEGILK